MSMHVLSSTVKTGLSADIDKLKSTARKFLAAYTSLDKIRPDPVRFPAQYKKWAEIKSYGDKTRESVAWITKTIDTAGNVADSVWYGVTHPFGYNPFNLAGLGILPLIPVAGVAVTGAVIASSIAAMTYFISSAYEYGKFADATPEVRAELQKRAASTGIASITGMLGSVTGLLVVAGIIYFLRRKK
jgi:hypothetical protein